MTTLAGAVVDFSGFPFSSLFLTTIDETVRSSSSNNYGFSFFTTIGAVVTSLGSTSSATMT